MITKNNQEVIFEEVTLLLDWFPDFIGCLGAIIVLLAYILLQARKIEAENLVYSLLNLGGAFMILISLFYAWNLAAVAMEIAWILISLFGLLKAIFPNSLKSSRKRFKTRNL